MNSHERPPGAGEWLNFRLRTDGEEATTHPTQINLTLDLPAQRRPANVAEILPMRQHLDASLRDVAFEYGNKVLERTSGSVFPLSFQQAVVKMVMNDLFGKRLEGAPGRDQLIEHLGTLTIPIQHSFYAVQLTDNAPKTEF